MDRIPSGKSQGREKRRGWRHAYEQALDVLVQHIADPATAKSPRVPEEPIPARAAAVAGSASDERARDE